MTITLKQEPVFTIEVNGQELTGFTVESEWEGFKKMRRGPEFVILATTKAVPAFTMVFSDLLKSFMEGKPASGEYCALMASPSLHGPMTPPKPPAPFDLAAHLRRQFEFSQRTFGPGPRVKMVTDHIEKELVEVRDSNGDLEEWVDLILLSLDGALRTGAPAEQIIHAIVAKQTTNEGRTWPDWRTEPADQAIEHVRKPGGEA